MKIFTIAATPFFSDRGCHIRIYNEAKYLKDLGAEVFIATYHLGKDIKGFQIARIGNVSWYQKLSPGFAWGKLYLDLKLLWLSIKEIKKFQPDIIHAHLYEGLVIGKLAKLLTASRAKIIFDLQGDIEKEMNSYNKENSWAGKFFSFLAKIVIGWADRVVLSSDRVLENTKFFYKGKLEIVKDGVDLQLYMRSQQTENELVKDILNWKGSNQLLIYTGSVDDSKGVGDLINEFINISSHYPNWKLLLAGHGKDLEKYRTLVKGKSMDDKIRLVGGTSYFELPQYLCTADLAIDPKTGTTEASGKLVNYMAAKLPIICFENDFNKSFLKNDGLYIQDIAQLPSALNEYAKNGKRFVDYDLNELDEKIYAGKLFQLMQ